jgi:hypothetical protein
MLFAITKHFKSFVGKFVSYCDAKYNQQNPEESVDANVASED